MSGIALALTNVALGVGNIGAGIGFSVAEQNKVKKLNKKADKLREDATEVGELYDHVYYLIAVNLDRVTKALDKLPSDLLDKVEKQIESDMKDTKFEKAMKILANVLGYTGGSVGVVASLLQLAIKLRQRKADGLPEPEETSTEDPFNNVPIEDEHPITPVEPESSMPQSQKLTKIANGLNIAGVVFGVAGLATTIGLGVWTLEKLDKALSDVKKKQAQVDAYKTAMTEVLDEIITAAGLEAKDYDALPDLAETWKKISDNFDSYEKVLYYAIKDYFAGGKTQEEIQKDVDSKGDASNPFPEDGYPLAKTLADDITYLFNQEKTDKEVVSFFATENPNIGLRFVFNEYFISSLRWL